MAKIKSMVNNILSNCREEFAFWTQNGRVINNIYKLAGAIESMDLYAFRYHVNTDNSKNDFSKWIDEVLGDEKLASKLRGVHDPDKYARIIRKRIKQLEDIKFPDDAKRG